MARKVMLKIPGMKDVDDSGGGFHIAAGEYTVRCTSVVQEESSKGNQMLTLKFEGLEGKSKGKTFRYTCSLLVQALWNLKRTMKALGLEPPDEDDEMDPDDFVGCEAIAVVVDDEYEGRTNSKIAELRPSEGGSDEGDEDEDKKPAKAANNKSKNGGKSKSQKFAATEIEAMEDDELEEINDKNDLGVDLSAFKTTIRRRNAIISALQSAKMLEA